MALEDQLTTYEVDPALEYRTFAHVFNEPTDYQRASIRGDGRVLAVGTGRGAVLWDLARGIELAVLPIGNAWHVMFEPSGDLITSGSIGVQRWPVRLDPARGEFRIGPPRRLPLPVGFWAIAEDRVGPDRGQRELTIRHSPDPGADVPAWSRWTTAAMSPSALTGNGWRPAAMSGVPRSGASAIRQRWPICPSIEARPVDFSPDGKWLMTSAPSVPTLGRRHLARGAADRR